MTNLDHRHGAASDHRMLSIENLSIAYRAGRKIHPVVSDFSLAIRTGESVGLVGESGCGKSTVAMAIMRYLGRNGVIQGGRILFKGRDMAGLSREQLQQVRGSGMAMVYQEPAGALNPSLTIGRQLLEVALLNSRLSRKAALDRVVHMLKDVKINNVETTLQRYPHQLSGGQQQRIVIALSLLSDPSLLILDEPTTALDPTVGAAIMDLLSELRHKYGTSFLFISHNLGLVKSICDRVIVMYAGQLVEEAQTDQLFESARHPYTLALFDCIPKIGAKKDATRLRDIAGQMATVTAESRGCRFGPRCDHFESGTCSSGTPGLSAVGPQGHHVRCIRWSGIGAGRTVKAAQPAPETAAAIAPGNPALEIVDLEKVYELPGSFVSRLLARDTGAELRANDKLNFDVRGGEVLAIVGESGCGKSTFARILMGLESVTGGSVIYDGRDIARIPAQEREKDLLKALQMVFQNPTGALNPSHTIGWSIGRVLRKLGREMDGRKIGEQVDHLLTLVGLPGSLAKRKPGKLSGGQKQRVAIARAFASNPALVIADEPVSALDVSVQATILNLLVDIQRKYRTALIFISHDLNVVHYLADRVVVMYQGQIVEAGSRQSVFAPPHHPYTEALLSAAPQLEEAGQPRHIQLADRPSATPAGSRGCHFAAKCPRKLGAICDTAEPPERLLPSGHGIRCHIPFVGPETIDRAKPEFAGVPEGARTQEETRSSAGKACSS